MEESKIRVLLRQYYASKGFPYDEVKEIIDFGEVKSEKQEVIHTLPATTRGSQRRDIYLMLVSDLVLIRSEYYNAEKDCWDHWSVICP